MFKSFVRHLPYFLLGVVLMLVAALLGSEKDQADVEAAHYCEMVALHKVDPTVGWPDYNQTYDRDCEYGTPKR